MMRATYATYATYAGFDQHLTKPVSVEAPERTLRAVARTRT